MNEEYGIWVAQTDRSLGEHDPQFDSLNPTVLISTSQEPIGIRRIDVSNLSNVDTSAIQAGGFYEEVLEEFNHGLGVIPQVFAFIQVRDAPDDYYTLIGGYGFQAQQLLSPGIGITVVDAVWVVPDEQKISIKHRVEKSPTSTETGMTSSASYSFSVKLYVTNQEALYDPGYFRWPEPNPGSISIIG